MSKLWNNRGEPNPEHFAATVKRFCEQTLALRESRRTVKPYTEPLKPKEAMHSEKARRAVPHQAYRCKATKMDGKQCEFRAKCGEFCTKHAVNKM
jgi:hypothetical protein